jgi:para-nitrobenzyl esterase
MPAPDQTYRAQVTLRPGLPPWHPFDDARPVPHVQSLAPGPDGIGPVDHAAEHQLDFWSNMP